MILQLILAVCNFLLEVVHVVSQNVAWCGSEMSKITLSYERLVERYPRSNGVVGNSIPNREIFSLFDKESNQVAACLLCFNIYIYMI